MKAIDRAHRPLRMRAVTAHNAAGLEPFGDSFHEALPSLCLLICNEFKEGKRSVPNSL